MARQKTITTDSFLTIEEDGIEKIIDEYGRLNEIAKTAKKGTDHYGTIIKDYLKENQLEKKQGVDKWAKVSVSTSYSYIDDKLLEKVKSMPETVQKQLIKIKEIVDTEKLEELIVAGTVSKEDIMKCIESKETTKLYVK